MSSRGLHGACMKGEQWPSTVSGIVLITLILLLLLLLLLVRMAWLEDHTGRTLWSRVCRRFRTMDGVCRAQASRSMETKPCLA